MGAWTSNLYSMGKTFMAMLFARKSKKVQSFRDPTFLSDNNLKKGYNAAPDTSSSDYTPTSDEQPATSLDFASLKASLARSVSAEKGTTGVEERKALLRKQLALIQEEDR